MKLLTAAEMRELDRQTIEEIGVPGVVLMENAGRAAAETLVSRYGHCYPGPVLILAGKGNNGGDGYVIARSLLDRGWQVLTVVLASSGTVTGDARQQLEILQRCGGEVIFADNDAVWDAALNESNKARLLVDALFGTGLNTTVTGLPARVIDWINASALPVLAVDIPSGLDATSGCVLGRAVRAETTVTFACAKIGHAVFPGVEYTGRLEIVDIGLPASLTAVAGSGHELIGEKEAAALLPARPVSGHKGTFGHLLVVAGSTGKSGAAAMTSLGGVRSGAGLVTVAAPHSVQKVLEIKLTEAMTEALEEAGGEVSLQASGRLAELWTGKSALALGPGLGQSEETQALVRRLIRDCPLPMVIDADGLNALAGHLEALRERHGRQTVLTPHPGEMARLLGSSVAEVESDRIAAARDFACRHQVVLVLKGARTVSAFPDGRIKINGSGHAGMASGGTGDVLTGLVGGLLAQGCGAANSAVLGVYLHGLAADRLRSRFGAAGLAATDLLPEIPAARDYLSQGVYNAQS